MAINSKIHAEQLAPPGVCWQRIVHRSVTNRQTNRQKTQPFLAEAEAGESGAPPNLA